MKYRALFSHQWLRRLRQPRPRLFWLSAVLVGILLLYAVVGLVATALALEVLLYLYLPGVEPLHFVNSRLPEVALGLLIVRYFFQKTPRGAITPYLHLPICRGVLARFFVLSSLLSLHNLLPLFFAVPFMFRTVAEVGGATGAALWLGGFVALLVASDLVNTWARSAGGHRPGRFVLVALVLAGLVALDAAGTGWLRLGGWLLFQALASGSWIALLGCWLAVALLFAWVTAVLRERLRTYAQPRRDARVALRFDPRYPLRNLVQLELTLILRNTRPRQFVFVSLVFSTVYLIALLPQTDSAIGALLLGFMASGMFSLNYGPMMFGWESAFFDGYLARPLPLDRLVRSKLILLQGSSVVLAGVALPFFAGFAPMFLPHLVAATLYNAGVGGSVALWLALGNRTRLDLDKGSVFNFQGVSAEHMLWTALLALPPVALVLLLGDWGLAALSAIGVASALLLLAWPIPFTARLHHNRHRMAAAFRSSVA